MENQDASAAKDRLIATLGHELRGALNVALCWSNVLLAREDALAEPVRRGLRAIVRSTRLQKRLIEDVLDFTRMEHGDLSVQLGPCDLSRLALEAVSALEPRAAELGIALSAHVARGVQIFGDEARAEQLLHNLLDNALKFSAVGDAVRLTLEVEHGVAELCVRDTGRGIAPDLLARIFDWRVQAEPQRYRSAGLGLGLAIAQRISALHGGTLCAESAGTGHGATFRWRVPLASVESA